MSISAIRKDAVRSALVDMTGAVDVIEATFTPWDADQADALASLLSEMNGLDELDQATFGDETPTTHPEG